MDKLKLFLVGGFLGSGKTTAILQAAQYLYRNGKKVGVITNDQGMQQVDTQFIKGHQIPSGEVANGCFCCQYNELEKNLDSLQQLAQTEFIFAESVGTCTDLAATVVNPLLTFNPGRYEIVLSIFADVRLLVKFLQDGKSVFFDPVSYIYERQLIEADIIVVNKIDLLNEKQQESAEKLIRAAYRGKTILFQNSQSEVAIQPWLAACAAVGNQALRPSLDIDYDIYGAGEAELAWLDEEIGIVTDDGSAGKAAQIFSKKLYDRITADGYMIGHLKFLADDGKRQEKISFTTLPGIEHSDTVNMQTDRIVVLINARVQIRPALLQSFVNDIIIETELEANCKITEYNLSAFQPGYPRPTYRIRHGAEIRSVPMG
jgi:Ni2+-binding GTPase involved in maturation of urease and hydrogenase